MTTFVLSVQGLFTKEAETEEEALEELREEVENGDIDHDMLEVNPVGQRIG